MNRVKNLTHPWGSFEQLWATSKNAKKITENKLM
jgi:hypothetical protein